MILKVIGYILGACVLAGLVWYLNAMNGFKKFVAFEAQVKKNPTDELIEQYITMYKKTFIPNQPQLKASRAQFYQAVRTSDNVSHKMKTELRSFLTSKGVELAQVKA